MCVTLVLPIGFFAPLPLAIMIPFMAAQSFAMGQAFGTSFQYGKRKISSMSNEDFNKYTAEQAHNDIQADIMAMIPSMNESFHRMETFQIDILVSMGKTLLLAVEKFFEIIGPTNTFGSGNFGSSGTYTDHENPFGPLHDYIQHGHAENDPTIPPTETAPTSHLVPSGHAPFTGMDWFALLKHFNTSERSQVRTLAAFHEVKLVRDAASFWLKNNPEETITKTTEEKQQDVTDAIPVGTTDDIQFIATSISNMSIYLANMKKESNIGSYNYSINKQYFNAAATKYNAFIKLSTKYNDSYRISVYHSIQNLRLTYASEIG